MVEYILEPNGLTTKPNQHKARVVNTKSYNFDDIASYMLKHNTGLSPSVIYGVWEGIKGAVENLVFEGGAINTELFRARASIRGVFDSAGDRYDANRHVIRLKLRPGSLLQSLAGKLKARKLRPAGKSFIRTVYDIKTGTSDSFLTPGNNIRIKGQRLQIKGTDPSCGVYLVSAGNTVPTVKIEKTELVANKPSEIIALIPGLDKGGWTIRLVTQYSNGRKCLKTPMNITYDREFTVS